MVARYLSRRALLAGVAMVVLAGAASLPELKIADTSVTAADGRPVKIRVMWRTDARGLLPLLLFSHGANGTLDGLVNLQRGLATGRIVAAPQHLDSEANPDLAKVDRATLFGTRVADMVAVADAIPAIEKLTGKRIDAKRIEAGGHSFGGLIAQALGGAWVAAGPGSTQRSWRDARIKTVVAFSPPGPVPPSFTAEGWAKIAVPQLVVTGTADNLPMIAPKWDAHTVSWQASTVRGSALWVGKDVDHYFGNRIQRLTREAPDQSAQFTRAVEVADVFLTAYEKRDRFQAMPLDALTERFEVK